MSLYIKTLQIRFKNEISSWEIPLFRGCVINSIEKANILFHNHEDNDKFRYSYPLIQYKRIGGKAAIVCIGEGTDAIGELFQSGNFTYQLGERSVNMKIEHINPNKTPVQIWDGQFHYVIRKWLPLSSDNYTKYRAMEGIAEKVEFLQRILIGNILSFCKGMGISIEKEITCVISNILQERLYTHKGVKVLGFDVEFKSNISIPDYIGLGKGVSIGFGTITRKNN